MQSLLSSACRRLKLTSLELEASLQASEVSTLKKDRMVLAAGQVMATAYNNCTGTMFVYYSEKSLKHDLHVSRIISILCIVAGKSMELVQVVQHLQYSPHLLFLE